MLIRSQNKEQLYNLDSLYGICYEETHDYKKGKEISTNHEICVDTGVVDSIGAYSTKEKAIKVLDMIQEKFQEPIYQNDVGGNEIAIYKNVVFQMPQDNEV